MQNREYIMNELAKFGKSEAFEYLMSEVEKNIFEKFKIMLDKEGALELFYVLKGLREVESVIQMSINENYKSFEENS